MISPAVRLDRQTIKKILPKDLVRLSSGCMNGTRPVPAGYEAAFSLSNAELDSLASNLANAYPELGMSAVRYMRQIR